MKVYLDDERTAPDGWIQARWPEDVIKLMEENEIEEISLDHDLADPLVVGQGYCSSVKERTGYDVLIWIEYQVATMGFIPPKINIHTANCSAYKKMQAALDNINKLLENLNEEKNI